MSDRLAERVSVRLPSEHCEQLDRLVDSGAYPSRSAAIRAAIATWAAIEQPPAETHS